MLLLKREGYQTALHTYQSLRDRFNDQYMEIQQTKEPSAKQAANWVPLCEIRELMDEYDEHAKLLRSQTDVSIKDKVAMQDRFMLHFWTTYPMRNDLHNTRVLSKRMFNALDQNDKDNNNYIILGKKMVLSIGNYKTRKKYGVKKILIEDAHVLKAMKQWLSVSPNPEYILVNVKDGTPMSSLHITQNFTRIFKKHFNKNVGSTLLRLINRISSIRDPNRFGSNPELISYTNRVRTVRAYSGKTRQISPELQYRCFAGCKFARLF